MRRKHKRLVSQLREAERRFRAVGNEPIFSTYDSGPAIADIIASACDQLQSGDLNDDLHKELWGIFAPTCDWDDVIGDVDLGNEIFERLDKMRRWAL